MGDYNALHTLRPNSVTPWVPGTRHGGQVWADGWGPMVDDTEGTPFCGSLCCAGSNKEDSQTESEKDDWHAGRRRKVRFEIDSTGKRKPRNEGSSTQEKEDGVSNLSSFQPWWNDLDGMGKVLFLFMTFLLLILSI